MSILTSIDLKTPEYSPLSHYNIEEDDMKTPFSVVHPNQVFKLFELPCFLQCCQVKYHQQVLELGGNSRWQILPAQTYLQQSQVNGNESTNELFNDGFTNA